MHSQIRTRTRVAGLGLALLLATVASVQAGPQEDFETGAASYRNGDIVGAMPPLRRAADAGHVEAQLQFGFILDWSEENAEAVRYYRMAADSGDPRGQLELARMYLSGEGVEPDPEVARGWIEKAAAQRHAPALTQLGHGYLDGGLGLAADEAQARSH
ncbi:MAG TPA: tetratricopeptide repeat protein, partial [Gammaproteobacteria bacterium]